MSKKEIELLEEFQNLNFKARNTPVKHSTKFSKHNPSIPEEDGERINNEPKRTN